MPKPISWSAKHAPDPKHPGYVKVVGSYAHDFIQWAKIFGAPAWSRNGEACVLSPDIKEIGDESVTLWHGIYFPLRVLEPLFEASLKARVVPGLIVGDEQKFYLR